MNTRQLTSRIAFAEAGFLTASSIIGVEFTGPGDSLVGDQLQEQEILPANVLAAAGSHGSFCTTVVLRPVTFAARSLPNRVGRSLPPPGSLSCHSLEPPMRASAVVPRPWRAHPGGERSAPLGDAVRVRARG